MKTIRDVWEAAIPRIQNSISVTGYKTTFPNLFPIELNGSTLVIGAKHELFKSMAESMYVDVITKAIMEETGLMLNLEFIVSEKEPEPPPQKEPMNEVRRSNNLNPKFTFEDFVVGSHNDFACAASFAVADAPAQRYNPLLIYGGSGLGKTHLLHAVGNSIYKQKPGWKIVCTTAEQFMNHFVESIRNENNQEFRAKYRDIDLLLIDDIQFFAGKEGTQEEFFHTFNELINYNKQIMLTSDRPAKDIYPLEERLRTRLAGGLTVDVKMPDFETRLAIIKKKAESENYSNLLSEEVFALVARQVKSNIRELEGAIKTIVAYSQISKKQIDGKVANKILMDYFSYTEEKKVDAELIIEEVERFYNLNRGMLISKKRDKECSYPRQVAMFIAREMTEMSLPEIGSSFGGRDHTTVMYAIKKIKGDVDKNVDMFKIVNSIMDNIRSAAT